MGPLVGEIALYESGNKKATAINMVLAHLGVGTKRSFMASHDEVRMTKEQREKTRALLVSFVTLSSRCYRPMTTIMVKMLATNIAVMNAVAMACVLNADWEATPFQPLGECGQDGFTGYLMELAIISAPFFLFDVIDHDQILIFENAIYFGKCLMETELSARVRSRTS